MPDFDSLSAGPAITAGAGGGSGSGGASGAAGSAGSAGSGGSAGTGGSGGSAGTSSAFLPDGGLANLIVNPDFEEVSQRWTQIGNCQLRIVTEPPAQSGSRSLAVSNRTSEWEGAGYPVLNLLQDGHSYDISVWVRVEEGEIPMQVTFKRRCDGDADTGYFLPTTSPVVVTTSWTHLTGTVTHPGCDSSESVIFIEVPNASASDPNAHVSYYIDNASLVQSE